MSVELGRFVILGDDLDVADGRLRWTTRVATNRRFTSGKLALHRFRQ